MEALQIPTEWDSSASNVNNKRLPIQESNIDIFRSHKATEEHVIHYCDLVWVSTPHGTATPEYFSRFSTPPTSNDDLNQLRNTRKLKHLILGKKIWKSLTSAFQMDI